MRYWNNQKLEPVLITFNRAKNLEETLSAFFNAGLGAMRLHILDNCSTDNTADIVKKFQVNWPNLQYHCNQYNIGGNANILRALEIANSEYHWVIGDDDEWYLENVNELVEALENTSADIIRLGWQATQMSRGKQLSSTTLIEQETMFFGSTSMISATIVRRSLVAKYLRQAYSNISNYYPQLIPIILASEASDLLIYTLNKNLMLHTPSTEPGSFVGDLEWYTAWFKTGLFFTKKKWRCRFNQEILHYIGYISKNKKTRLPPWLFLIRLCLTFKSLGISQARYLAECLIYGVGARKLFCLAAIAYCLTPSILAVGLRELYRKLYKLPPKNIIRDHTR